MCAIKHFESHLALLLIIAIELVNKFSQNKSKLILKIDSVNIQLSTNLKLDR